MDAKATVHGRYPQAEARYHGPLYEDGGQRPTRSGYWVIAPSAGAGTSFIGRGATEAEAWERAAAAVKAQED